MSLSTAITADIRSRAAWLPYCPICSLQVGTKEQILRGPTHRQFRGVFKLDGCCQYSSPPENYFDSEADASAWWRAARLLEVGRMADEKRRRLTLQRLETANLEAIE